jgi:hypothetical protein
VHGDIGTIPRELKGDRAAEAGRGSRDEGSQAMEIALVSRGISLPFADFSLREGGRTLLARFRWFCQLLLRIVSVVRTEEAR